MTKINFTKMEGIGNDYIYVNLFEETLSKPEELAKEMSHRRYGIGSDGLILVAPSQVADVKMVMFNSDGSESEMCGNGIRCVGKFARERGLVKENCIDIETGAGIKTLNLKMNSSDKVVSVTVQMGEPELDARRIPSTLSGDQIVDHPFEFDGFRLNGTLVSMGNPHLITFVEDVKNTPVKEWGFFIDTAVFLTYSITIHVALAV